MAEKIGFSPEGKNLIGLSLVDQIRVIELMNLQNGLARIFIHPFYRLHGIENKNGTKVSITDIVLQAEGKRVFSNEEKELLNHIMDSRRFGLEIDDLKFINGNFTPKFNCYLKSLARVLRANPPLLMLGEESGHVEETIAAFRQLGFNNEILYYKTEESGPGVNTGPYHKLTTNLSPVAKTLSIFRVKNLLVGGQYSTFDKAKDSKVLDNSKRNGSHIFKMKKNDNNKFEYTPSCCVGGFACSMNETKLFKSVIISQVSFPDAHPAV